MDSLYIFKSILALAFVLVLLAGAAFLVRKFGEKFVGYKVVKNPTFKIEEISHFDLKRKLVLFSYNKKKYLVLTGQNDLLIDTFEG